MRKIYYWDRASQKMVEKPPVPIEVNSHFVIQDTMAPTKHPVDQKIYESKSAFRRVTRANGYREVGNDWSGNQPAPVEPRFSDPVPILKELLNKH